MEASLNGHQTELTPETRSIAGHYSSFQLIPEEVWTALFLTLKEFDDFLSSSCVCVIWRQVAERVLAQAFSHLKEKDNRILRFFSSLVQLDLSRNKIIRDNGISNLVNLTKL